MINETVQKIEARIARIESLDGKKKSELADLLATLKTEIMDLAETRQDDAETITRFTELSACEAARTPGSPRLKKLSLEGLSASVEGFEASHPRLVQVVNHFCTTLANLGV
ncbi:MAG: DUF4404 family protein [Nitrospinaceae bacterium]|nr:DUF4404 family protein [Nitrospinaceae bacterium]